MTLWNPYSCDFQWSTDNFGATYSDTGIGTQVTSNTTTAHVVGADVTLISAGSVTNEVCGIALGFSGGSATAASRRWLANLRIDEAGGTSFTTRIPNLMVCGPSLILGGYWYYFPLRIKAGSTIGMNVQADTANITMRATVRLFGRPSRPELCRMGSYIETFGVATASSAGTAVTPGTSAKGSYTASLGATSRDLWWWTAGIASADTTRSALGYVIDIAVNTTTKKLVSMDIPASSDSSERFGLQAAVCPCIMNVPPGDDVFVRMACTGTPDATITTAAYGLGG